jgi:putative addiction module killer protein
LTSTLKCSSIFGSTNLYLLWEKINYEQWKIDYWSEKDKKSPVEKWLDDLTEDQLESVTKKVKLLEKMGNDLKMPHSFPLSKGLFELREMHYGYRIYYGFKGSLMIILLVSGDKSSQGRDIKIARDRLAKLLGIQK